MSSPNSFVDQTGDMSNMTVIRRLSINRLLVGMVPRWWTQRMENAGGTEEHPISVSSDPCIPRPRIRGRPRGMRVARIRGPKTNKKGKPGADPPRKRKGTREPELNCAPIVGRCLLGYSLRPRGTHPGTPPGCVPRAVSGVAWCSSARCTRRARP